MPEETLPAENRGELGSAGARRLRRVGRLPAVLYGHGMEPLHLSVDLSQFEHLLTRGARVVSLVVNGTEASALIKDLQYDAYGSGLLHADFQRLVAGQKVEVAVPVEVVGEAVGVRRDGGVLDQVLKEVTVSCLPGLIPDVVRVDVRELAIGDNITVSQVQWPEGVEPLAEGDQRVVSVLPPQLVAEEPVAEEAKEPEVIRRAPKEEEEGKESPEEAGGREG
jgi:large subunit ribosomal protein L25